MGAEDRIKMLIGELHVQNAVLAAKLEEAQARIMDMERGAETNIPKRGNGKNRDAPTPPP